MSDRKQEFVLVRSGVSYRHWYTGKLARPGATKSPELASTFPGMDVASTVRDLWCDSPGWRIAVRPATKHISED